MARKEDIFDNEIEVIDFDLEDIEDRIVENLESAASDELPEIADALDIAEEELPEIADVSEEKEEFSVVEPEEALAEVTQTVAVAAPAAEAEKEDAEAVVEKKADSSEKSDGKKKAASSEKEKKAKSKKKKKSGTDIVRSFCMIIAVCVLVYAGYQLTMIFMEYKEATDEYDQIEAFTDTNEVVTYNADYDLGDPFNPNFTPTQVNWQDLVSLNSEIYAWIEFENAEMGINYPIAKGVDNLYYLEHTVNGTANSSGSIYIDCENDPYFHDTNTFIYGHNMKNGSMFGNLKKYKNAEFFAGNEYFWIYTPDSRSRYKIFAFYEPAADSDAYMWWSDFCDEYTAYLQTAKANSMYDTGVGVEADDKIVTLSTCTSRDEYRFIVQAKLIYREFK